jgi:nucleoside-diphosphate-sugar epimerase
MRIFLTGATGFLMSAVARQLVKRGDGVVALVREPRRAGALTDLGCELVAGDLSDEPAIRRGLAGADAAIHGAAIYEIGIPRSRRAAMFDANVRGAERVLSSALEAGTPRVIHVSTIAVFGNTRGAVVDESYRRSGPYTSYYEETKYRAHEIALRLIERGLPCVIVQPGQLYGPGDHSGVGGVMRGAATGRLAAVAFGSLGLDLVHVDDAATGVILALDRGRPGESYVLGGEITTLRGMIDVATRLQGRRAPRFEVPRPLLRLAALLVPSFAEVVRSGDGVTFWARDAKARRELGYDPRGLERGLRDTFGLAG